MVMGSSSILQLNSSQMFGTRLSLHHQIPKPAFCGNRGRIRAIGTIPGSESEPDSIRDPNLVKFAFVSSVLLPDGSPDVHFRSSCGGLKLRDIMIDSNVELHGPYSRPLLNCGGGGTCGTCLVEVVMGKQLLSAKTDKEKEKLKKNPKNWRLACQTTVVGPSASHDLVVIQQMPEWKDHEWGRDKIPPPYEEDDDDDDES